MWENYVTIHELCKCVLFKCVSSWLSDRGMTKKRCNTRSQKTTTKRHELPTKTKTTTKINKISANTQIAHKYMQKNEQVMQNEYKELQMTQK